MQTKVDDGDGDGLGLTGVGLGGTSWNEVGSIFTSTVLTIESLDFMGKIEIGGSITLVRFTEICLFPDIVLRKLIILFMFLIFLDLLIYLGDLPIFLVFWLLSRLRWWG